MIPLVKNYTTCFKVFLLLIYDLSNILKISNLIILAGSFIILEKTKMLCLKNFNFSWSLIFLYKIRSFYTFVLICLLSTPIQNNPERFSFQYTIYSEHTEHFDSRWHRSGMSNDALCALLPQRCGSCNNLTQLNANHRHLAYITFRH